jgi:hypothetical protein
LNNQKVNKETNLLISTITISAYALTIIRNGLSKFVSTSDLKTYLLPNPFVISDHISVKVMKIEKIKPHKYLYQDRLHVREKTLLYDFKPVNAHIFPN